MPRLLSKFARVMFGERPVHPIIKFNENGDGNFSSTEGRVEVTLLMSRSKKCKGVSFVMHTANAVMENDLFRKNVDSSFFISCSTEYPLDKGGLKKFKKVVLFELSDFNFKNKNEHDNAQEFVNITKREWEV